MIKIIRDSKGRFMKGSIAAVSHPAWNKGLKGFLAGIPKNKGKHWKLSEETIKKVAASHTKHKPVTLICKYCQKEFDMKPYHLKSRKGYNRQFCSQLCYGQSMVGKKITEENRLKLIASNLGRSCSENTKLRISLANTGENNGNWNGGSSFEPYGLEFNDKLKEQIIQRDGFRCQECFRHQNELKRKLHIHHIDFNKQNNNPLNLIALCGSCHSQTQFDRDNWINYFNNSLCERGLK